jgi:signal transduction histidine kinase
MVHSGRVATTIRKVAAPQDPKGRLISIFVGAVLLPSVALSYVAIDFVPKLASATRSSEMKRAEKALFYLERDLEQLAQTRALEAARAVGAERLLDGRPEVIRAALREAGLGQQIFETLHLEAFSPRSLGRDAERRGAELPRELLAGLEPGPEAIEDWVLWPSRDGQAPGVVRFRFACPYHQDLVREYFEREFSNPGGVLVVRVTEPDGAVLHETAPTPNGRFEVVRSMDSPSFRGLRLHLRYRERSIDEDVRNWELATLGLIGFIDLVLGAGLFLVYFNVRRELNLSRLKSDFVANVSHELKTPLALIRLFAETLEMGRVGRPEKARDYYRIINKESQRLTQLINNILDFSRIEAGRKEYRFAPVSLPRVVDEVLEAYGFPMEQQGFALEVKIADDLPEVEADAEALAQALINLVNNAIKYSRDEKRIEVEVKAEGEQVRISVTDHGIGIPKAEQAKIFEKFFRGEDSLVHETKGSGLGLSLVRHIVEAHGGSVEVDSAPGRGSTFTLVLPVARGGAA